MKKDLILLFLLLFSSNLFRSAFAVESLESLSANRVLSDIKAKRLAVTVDEKSVINITQKNNNIPQTIRLSDPLIDVLSSYALKSYMNKKNPLKEAIVNGDVFGFMGIYQLGKTGKIPPCLFPLPASGNMTLSHALKKPVDRLLLHELTNPLLLDGKNVSLCCHAVNYGRVAALRILLNTVRKDHGREGLLSQVNTPVLSNVGITIGGTRTVSCGNCLAFQATMQMKNQLNIENQLNSLIKKATVINCVPLHVAISLGRPDIVKILLQHLANPDIPDVNNKTPLHVAIKKKDIASIKLLLDFHADPNALLKYYAARLCPNLNEAIYQQSLERYHTIPTEPPLYYAIENGFNEAVKILLAGGASLTILNNKGFTPLQVAAKHNDGILASIFIAYGAQTTNCPNRVTPLEIAAQNGALSVGKKLLLVSSPTKEILVKVILKTIEAKQVQFARLLLDKSSLHLTNEDLKKLFREARFPFYPASEEKNIIARILINRSPDKISLLYDAIDAYDTFLVETLLQCNVNPNLSGGRLESPLSHAIERQYSGIIELLLRYNADPNRDNQGLKPWSYLFSRYSFFSVAKKVLMRVPVDSRCKGKTPLHWAAECGRTDIMRFLLKRNADPRCLDDTNCSPLQLALKNRNLGAIRLLLPAYIKNHSFIYQIGLPAILVAIYLVYKKLRHKKHLQNVSTNSVCKTNFLLNYFLK
ncbi:hypothetical protein E3J79_02670 [Candidatus Dependentiae bacterium]|nr:MAG: hypothetical protein E3J79_02670 [Candidatus Dependentiae bacterium]